MEELFSPAAQKIIKNMVMVLRNHQMVINMLVIIKKEDFMDMVLQLMLMEHNIKVHGKWVN